MGTQYKRSENTSGVLSGNLTSRTLPVDKQNLSASTDRIDEIQNSTKKLYFISRRTAYKHGHGFGLRGLLYRKASFSQTPGFFDPRACFRASVIHPAIWYNGPMNEDARGNKPKKRSFLPGLYEDLLIVVIFVLFLRVFVFQNYKVPTESMVDTILPGDRLIVNMFCLREQGHPLLDKVLPVRKIERGDPVAFRFPKDPRLLYVKRVIGLPGDIVTVRGKYVFIDGAWLHEPYARFADAAVYRPPFGPYRVPPGHYFVMGDNRDRSYDSRMWGPVSKDLVLGSPWVIFWSNEVKEYNPEATLAERAKDTLDFFTHFIATTRWDRILTFPE